MDFLFIYLEDMLPAGNAPSSHLLAGPPYSKLATASLEAHRIERLWSYDERHWPNSVQGARHRIADSVEGWGQGPWQGYRTRLVHCIVRI